MYVTLFYFLALHGCCIAISRVAKCDLLGLNFGQFNGKEVITYTLLCFILFPPFVTPLYSSTKCQSRVLAMC